MLFFLLHPLIFPLVGSGTSVSFSGVFVFSGAPLNVFAVNSNGSPLVPCSLRMVHSVSVSNNTFSL